MLSVNMWFDNSDRGIVKDKNKIKILTSFIRIIFAALFPLCNAKEDIVRNVICANGGQCLVTNVL